MPKAAERPGLTQALGRMDQDHRQELAPSVQLGRLSLSLLIKTLLKCFIWFGTAWLATRIWPAIVWPWYLAWIFVAIGMAASLLSLGIAFYSRDRELHS